MRFELADIADWAPSADTDVVVSNAALQWVPGHQDLMPGMACCTPSGGLVRPAGSGNFDAPSHALMRELALSSDPWAGQA